MCVLAGCRDTDQALRRKGSESVVEINLSAFQSDFFFKLVAFLPTGYLPNRVCPEMKDN